MKKHCYLLTSIVLLFIFYGCTNYGNPSSSNINNSTPISSNQSIDDSQAPEFLPTDSSTEYAKVIQGYSLQDIGLTVDTSKTFHDPNRNADGLWGAEHTAVSDYWNSGEFYGNVTRMHVDTSERMVDFTPNNMFILQCFKESECNDGTCVLLKEQSIPAADVRKTCIVEKDGYLICDVTGFFYPDESFEDRIQEQQELFPDYDFEWARSVYDYVSENLLDLIQPEAA